MYNAYFEVLISRRGIARHVLSCLRKKWFGPGGYLMLRSAGRSWRGLGCYFFCGSRKGGSLGRE